MSETAAPKLESSTKSFGGEQRIYSHDSRELACRMRFAVYVPAGCSSDNRKPVVYFLSGLTCTETNFIEKSGAQRYASELGLIIVCPDTSPRNVNLPGEDDSYDFGTGAGFYVNATVEPWSRHYRMYNYVTSELIELITANFDTIPGQQSIMGHSMGGHGALICGLRNPGLYQSVSAFAPICNPSQGAWGRKALTGYLGADETAWKLWDATELVAGFSGGNSLHLLIDQGGADQFLAQLGPDKFIAAAKANNIDVDYQFWDGYDHGYYFIATAVGKHLAHHSKYLK